jgi:RNA polymerase sigma-70 factor (ECF subfamily)
LYRIAANEITSYHRVNQKARTVSIEESSLAALLEEDLDENQWDKYKPKLTEALKELRETDLQLIEMRFFEQLSFKEIAEIVGLTESNTKVKTYRVLERIKQKLVT